MLFRSSRTLPLTYTEERVPLMSSDIVSRVLEEVAPVAMRGKEINSASFVSGCNEAQVTEYENVSIVRSVCRPLVSAETQSKEP